MKMLLIIMIMGWTTATVVAQDDGDMPASTDPGVAARIDAARAAYITQRLGLTTEEAERFWPIYREFAAKRQELRQRYIAAQRQGADEKELVDLGLEVKQQEVDLEKDYAGRMMKVISAQKLMDLRPAEREFRQIIIRQIRQRQADRKQDIQERRQEQLRRRNN